MSDSAPILYDPLPGILEAGTIALLNGSPNAGKTALLASILQRFHTGGTLFGFPVKPTPVFYIVMDRIWRTGAGKWFEKLGFDVPHYSFVDDLNMPAASFYQRPGPKAKHPWEVYTDILDRCELAAGTIIATDPMENAFGSVMDRRMVITSCTWIQRYLKLHHLNQWGMMHSGKMKTDEKARYANVHEQMAGTGALSGYSSTQMTLLAPAQRTQASQRGEDANPTQYEFHITSHSLPGMVFGLERMDDGLFDIDGYVRLVEGEIPEPDLAAPMNEKAQTVLLAIPDPPVLIRTGHLESHFQNVPGFSRPTVHRLLKELSLRKYIHTPHYGMWQRLTAQPAPNPPKSH